MEGCFCQRELVCIDGSDQNEKRKEVRKEQMGAAGFDHRYKVWQLCS